MDTKKLRQKILDLAIHGKLVPQDPNDEPASVLLERIREEKERLIKEGKIKRGKKSAKTSDTPHYEQVPFEVPEGWVWTTVSEVTNYGDCSNTSVDEIEDNEWILELEDIEKDSGRILFHRTKSERDIKGARHSFCKENILYSKLRTYLNKVLVAETNGFCTTEIIPFSVYGGICPNYICHVLRSEYFLEYTKMCGYGVKMPRLSTTDAQKGLIPLPPINEQIRIIESINKWFEAIDALENDRNSLEEVIIKAKSKILDLAIHGKLVPQDPKDEPAIELLKRINPKFTPCDNGQYEKLPKNWVSAKGLDIFSPMKSARPQGEYFDYIDIDSIDNKRQRVIAPKRMLSADAPSRASRFTHKGDTIFSMVRPYLKNIALVPKSDCIASTGFYVCSSNGSLDIQYCYYMMISPAIVDGLNSFMKGDNSPSITKKELDAFVFPVPPLAEQQRIVVRIEELFATLDKMQNSLEA